MHRLLALTCWHTYFVTIDDSIDMEIIYIDLFCRQPNVPVSICHAKMYGNGNGVVVVVVVGAMSGWNFQLVNVPKGILVMLLPSYII